MKRVNNIYDKIISVENLQLADVKARKNKEKSYGVRRHDLHREKNILDLHHQLKAQTFKTSTYDIFTIFTPKERTIYRLPYFPDRIVHHAIMNVLEPIWVSIFTRDTYACIRNRGTFKASMQVRKALQDKPGTKYCLKIDISKYYPSVDHDIMKAIVRKKIKCEHTLKLIDEIIDSAPGLPIGNYLSQYLANLYLAYFDHYVKEELKVKYYYRYVDDMVFLHRDKAYLHALLVNINHYLAEHLNLSLKPNYQVFPVAARGIDYLGFVHYHTHTLMRKKIKRDLCRKAAKLNQKDITVKDFKRAIAPRLGYAIHSNSKHLLKTILTPDQYESIIRRKARKIRKVG